MDLPPEREAEATLSKASRAEFGKHYDQAFRLYIKAAELFLYLSRSTTSTDKSKQQWKATASKALERAEKIKKFADSSKPTGSFSLDSIQKSTSDLRLTPVGVDHFSTQEQFYILNKGGNINGRFFSLWDEPILLKSLRTGFYSDPDGQPNLSPEQRKVSAVWLRPSPSTALNYSSAHTPRRILPQEVVQHIVTDCSVCASISVCVEHTRRFNSKLESLIKNTANQFSDNVDRGRYDVRVLINGAWRRIVIDNYLPYHPTEGTLMCMSITRSSNELLEGGCDIIWPSLLEKAYMKLMGGYDFPGSNSSIDLHVLAGWIPEYIDIKRSTFEREKTWERLESGFSSGHCVLTVGTGPSQTIQWRNIPLLPSHSYAVINAKETEEGRLLTLLDSLSPQNIGDERVLKIPWSDVLNIFDGIYLSWDPNLWEKQITYHGMWKRNATDNDGTKQTQLQFIIDDSYVDEELLVLLTRHVVDTHRTSDFMALRLEMVDDLFCKESNVEDQCILSPTGTYTNSTHVLARARILPCQGSGVLSIFASYDGDSREVGYTLTVFARASIKLTWIDNKSAPPYTNLVDGSWTAKNAGGNCTYPTFMVNPQYQLIVHRRNQKQEDGAASKARVRLTIQTKKDIPVNIAIVWSNGQRVFAISNKDLVTTSGAYSHGSARVATAISPGDYTIVVSAFEPRHMGAFSLKVDSSHPYDLKSIPQEGAGMYSKVIRGIWNKTTSAGAPSFHRYSKNPIFELDVPSTMQLKLRLQLLQPSNAIALNITVYYKLANNSKFFEQQKHVATSGAYDDAIAGVATPLMTVGKGKYYLVPSTYNPGTEAEFRILLYSTISGVKVTLEP